MKRAPRSEQGYALLFVFVMAAMIAIAMYAALPQLMFEAQRQREQLLIDRGEQYSLAIRRFFTKTGRYPTTLDELEKFQGIRFLRRRFKDPMTDSGEWRLVHMNAMGMMTDSKTQKPTGIGQMGQTAAQTSQFGTLTGSTLGNSLSGTTPGQDPNAAGANGQNGGQPQQPAWARRLRGPGGPGAVPGATPDNSNGDNQQQYPPDLGAAVLQQQQQQQQPGQPQQVLTGQPGQPQPYPQAPGFPPPVQNGQPDQSGAVPVTPPMGQPFPGMNPANPMTGQPLPNQFSQPGIVNPAAQQIMQRLTNPQGAIGQQNPGAGGGFAGGPGMVNAPPGGGVPNAGGAGSSPFQNGSSPFGNGPGGTGNSPFSGGGSGGGNFIAGVASKADGEGIKVYHDKTKYSEWEFLFDFKKLQQQQQQQAGQAQPGGAQPGNSPFTQQNGQPGGQNSPLNGQNNQFGGQNNQFGGQTGQPTGQTGQSSPTGNP